MQAAEGLRRVLRRDDERHVRVRGALRDEDDVHVAERGEDASRRSPPSSRRPRPTTETTARSRRTETSANSERSADDGLERSLLVDRDRDRDLARRDDVHGDRCRSKTENTCAAYPWARSIRGLPTKSAATPRPHRERAHARPGRLGAHDRPGRLRPEGVPHGDRDAARHGGPDRRRVKDLRAEERELRRLGRSSPPGTRRAAGDDARVGREDAVDVRPDLDRSDAERPRPSSAAPRSAAEIVRAAAPERRRHAVRRGSDEASRHDGPAAARAPGARARRPFPAVSASSGKRGAVARVRHEDLAGIDPRRVGAARRGAPRRRGGRTSAPRCPGAHPRSEERLLRVGRCRWRARRARRRSSSTAARARRGFRRRQIQRRERGAVPARESFERGIGARPLSYRSKQSSIRPARP